MAKRFLLIVALGSTLAVLGAGTASSLSVGVGDLTVTVPTLPGPVPQPLPDTNIQVPKLPNLGGGGSTGSSGGGSSGGGQSTAGGSSTSSGSSAGAGAGGTSDGKTGKSRRNGGGKGLFAKQKGKRQTAKDVMMDQSNGITQGAGEALGGGSARQGEVTGRRLARVAD